MVVGAALAALIATFGSVSGGHPYLPGTRYLDWELDDPAAKPLEDVRAIRDDIEQRVRALLADLDVPVSD